MGFRYRLYPTPAQDTLLRGHCAHARFVWNLAVEQQSWWHPGRQHAPRFVEQCRQLAEARAEIEWLRRGASVIQEQAVRDFDNAMTAFFRGTHRKPSWRKAGRNEGFRVKGRRGRDWGVRRISRHVGEVRIPKIGWVRFRWSRPVPQDAKSYRVTLDRAGRWHVAFASIPAAIPAPGTGEVVGVDLGIAVSAALSTGDLLLCPADRADGSAKMVRLQRHLARSRRGSNRRVAARVAIARAKARERDQRKDWVEKTGTALARRFDLIRVEDLRIGHMIRSAVGTVDQPGRNVRQKAGLNRAIASQGWGMLVKRLEEKAPGRVQKVNPRFTSQRCSACGHIAAESRKSQALFACVACNFTLNADVNAAINIAAGHAVNARGGDRVAGPVNREPPVVA